MVRKSLIVAALLAVSSPLAAQEQWVWSSNRPDGAAPLGVMASRTLAMGEIQVEYQWIQRNFRGVWFGKDSLDLTTTLALYEVAPLSMRDKRHSVAVAFGVTSDLTLRARGEFALLEREQLRGDGTYYITGANALGDAFADLTYNVLRRGPYRLDANVGVSIPVGEIATTAVTPYSMPAEEVQPYDMRAGTGSFGVSGSLNFDMQNEVASVGAQFKVLTYVNENSRGYTVGDHYQANGWAAYNFNPYVGVSAGARWEKWGNIDGGDTFLNGISMRDPMNDPLFLGGIRASMPLGINFILPSGPLAGHRLAFESVYALHHDYQGPQIGLDWGINIGYTAPF